MIHRTPITHTAVYMPAFQQMSFLISLSIMFTGEDEQNFSTTMKLLLLFLKLSFHLNWECKVLQ